MKSLSLILTLLFNFSLFISIHGQFPMIETHVLKDSSHLEVQLFETYRIDKTITAKDTSITIKHAYEVPFDTLMRYENLQTQIDKRPDYLFIKITEKYESYGSSNTTTIICYDKEFKTKNKGIIYYSKNDVYYNIGFFDESHLDSLIKKINELFVFNLAKDELPALSIQDCFAVGAHGIISFNIDTRTKTYVKNIALNPQCPNGPHKDIYVYLIRIFPKDFIQIYDSNRDYNMLESNQELIIKNKDLHKIVELL